MQFIRTYILRLIALVIIIALAFSLALIARDNAFIQDMVAAYGYFGIFLISFASGFNLLVPIPAVSFIPLYLESGLNLWVTLFIITIGMTTADSIAYLIGRLGRDVAHRFNSKRILEKIDSWQNKYRYLPLVILFLYASFAPLPNELLLIPLGIMGCSYRYIAPILLVGNGLFNTLTAFGILSIFNLFV